MSNVIHLDERIRCPSCQTPFKMKDLVVIDEINTLTHMKCFNYENAIFPIKDKGKYKIIIQKYGLIDL